MISSQIRDYLRADNWIKGREGAEPSAAELFSSVWRLDSIGLVDQLLVFVHDHDFELGGHALVYVSLYLVCNHKRCLDPPEARWPINHWSISGVNALSAGYNIHALV